MTTSRDMAGPGGAPLKGEQEISSPSPSIAWGRTVLTVLIGVALGSAYSLANRPVTAASPVELAAVDHAIVGRTNTLFEAMITETAVPERPPIFVADMIMLPVPASKSLRDVSVEPVQSAELPPQMSFRSIATLSAPSPRLEAEVRALKGKNDEESPARGAGKADAVAAVWGFLAVGLGGSTAAAPRSSLKQPR